MSLSSVRGRCSRSRREGADGVELLDALYEIGEGVKAQALGEDDHRVQARRAQAALEQADLGAVQIAGLREPLLRDASAFAQQPEVLCELAANLFGGHRLLRARMIHARESCRRLTRCLQTFVCVVSRQSSIG